MVPRVSAALIVLSFTIALLGCSTTAYYERERLADQCMQMDADSSVVYFRHKLEAAREGGFGGFGGSVAGGCGCQ